LKEKKMDNSNYSDEEVIKLIHSKPKSDELGLVPSKIDWPIMIDGLPKAEDPRNAKYLILEVLGLGVSDLNPYSIYQQSYIRNRFREAGLSSDPLFISDVITELTETETIKQVFGE
jgi:hypothetical protein